MLEIKELYAGYGRENVLEDINLKIEKNKITAVLGKNGCGKSTLAGCITKRVKYCGNIIFNGCDILELSTQNMAKNISYLPQKLESPNVTVKELVMFGRNPHMGFSNRASENDVKKAQLAMEITNTKNISECMMSKISGGERQRAFLAMILAQDTPFIILDEPTTYMDISCKKSFFKLLYDLKIKYNKTILIIMHDLSDAVHYADNIAVLDSKKAVFSGSASECVKIGAIEKVFDVKQHSFSVNKKSFTVFE